MNDHIIKIKDEWRSAKERYGADACPHIPVPVIYSSFPADAEYITRELSRYLYTEGILRKTAPGHKDYLVFPASYIRQGDKGFPLIQELYSQIMRSGGYYGPYRGVLLADVSEWARHFKDSYFDILLAYLADLWMDGLIPFFYGGSSDPGPELQPLEAVISPYFRNIRICYGAAELYGYAVSILEGEGFLLAEDACSYLEAFIRGSLRSPLFHGTESVRSVCENAARVYRPGQGSTFIDGPCLKGLITELGYTDLYDDSPRKSIGFR